MKRLAAAVIIALPFLVHASQGGAPPISSDRLPGEWEGILAEDSKVFLVSVGPRGTVAAMTTVVRGGNPSTITFAITATNVSEGAVKWDGTSSHGRRLQIRGNGTEINGTGAIHARWTLLSEKGKKVNEWQVVLFGRRGSYLAELLGAADQARKQLHLSPERR